MFHPGHRHQPSTIPEGPIIGTPRLDSGRPRMKQRQVSAAELDKSNSLSQCEDASLSWTLQFWVTLADPVNQSVFFANPATGQCCWDPPVGAYVIPRSPDGEWWELADSSRANRSYYYNTISGKTQWIRPNKDVMVIPLGLIQNNSLNPHPSRSTAKTPAASGNPWLGPTNACSPTSSSQHSTSTPPSKVPGLHAQFLTSNFSRPPSAVPRPLNPPSPYRKLMGAIPTQIPAWELQGAEIHAAASTQRGRDAMSVHKGLNFSPPWLERMGFTRPTKQNVGSLAKYPSISHPSLIDFSAPETPDNETGQTTPIDSLGRTRGVDGRPCDPVEPIKVDFHLNEKRLSIGIHPVLPHDISSEIQFFQVDDFAQGYFAIRRAGLFRKKVSVQRVMEWQKTPISAPLLVLSRGLWKDAVVAFKVVQFIMKDRDRRVEGAKPIPTSASVQQASANLAAGGEGRSSTEMEGMPKSEKVGLGVAWEEARWLVHLGATTVEIRDEIYCQLIKQLTRNPNSDSVFLGFQLLCVLVVAFGPSRDFEPYIRSILMGYQQHKIDSVGVMAKYCLHKLDLGITRGGRGKSLTQGEMEHAVDAAFNPFVFGQSLRAIMRHQIKYYPDLEVPVVLYFLARGILVLGGRSSEGTFRVSGDAEIMAKFKSQMDNGRYKLVGVDDPHVLASLFKLFLRDLETPLIPSEVYNEALRASREPSVAIEIVKRLPTYNRRVLVFVISFFQLFLPANVVRLTKMTSQNLAVVLAPNVLRTTSDSLVTVINNASFEAKFIHQLLLHMKPNEVDDGYAPTLTADLD